MFAGGVVDDEVGEHAQPPIAGVTDRLREVAQVPEPRVDAQIVRDVVSVVTVGRRVQRHQPQAGGAERGHVVEALDQPGEIAAPVAVGIGEGLDVEAVDDRVLPPHVARRSQPHEEPSTRFGRRSPRRDDAADLRTGDYGRAVASLACATTNGGRTVAVCSAAAASAVSMRRRGAWPWVAWSAPSATAAPEPIASLAQRRAPEAVVRLDAVQARPPRHQKVAAELLLVLALAGVAAALEALAHGLDERRRDEAVRVSLVVVLAARGVGQRERVAHQLAGPRRIHDADGKLVLEHREDLGLSVERQDVVVVDGRRVAADPRAPRVFDAHDAAHPHTLPWPRGGPLHADLAAEAQRLGRRRSWVATTSEVGARGVARRRSTPLCSRKTARWLPRGDEGRRRPDRRGGASGTATRFGSRTKNPTD